MRADSRGRSRYRWNTVVGIAVLFLGISWASGETLAETRNCSAEEKAAANEQLLGIQNAPSLKEKLQLYHTPVGAPEGIGSGNEQTLFQGGYLMGYDEDLMTSLWVAYRLTQKDRTEAEGKPRVNCFRADPRIRRGKGPTTTDYREPIFDQGHMANDADLKDNLLQQVNSYVMTNMSPQHCRFNRGIWLTMENLTRDWANTYGEVLVTSGAIFDRDNTPGRDPDARAWRMKSNNGKDRVAVPSHYFKAILRRDPDGWKNITFVFEHTNDAQGVAWDEVRPKVEESITSIERVEQLSSMNLYPHLAPNDVTESLDGTGWDFSRGHGNFSASCK